MQVRIHGLKSLWPIVVVIGRRECLGAIYSSSHSLCRLRAIYKPVLSRYNTSYPKAVTVRPVEARAITEIGAAVSQLDPSLSLVIVGLRPSLENRGVRLRLRLLSNHSRRFASCKRHCSKSHVILFHVVLYHTSCKHSSLHRVNKLARLLVLHQPYARQPTSDVGILV
jgi:hypothetical protein